MTPERRERLRDLLRSASALGEDRRLELLAELGADDPELAGELANALGELPAAPALAPEPEADRTPPTETSDGGAWAPPRGAPGSPASGAPESPWRIDRYLLLSEIGRGGMGVVHLAERADGAYHQRVAVKILSGGRVGSDEARRRFVAERQILARLAHPSIARLVDGGTTADGAPYLVMEYVEGRSIDRHVAERELALDEILALFRRVCEAVEVAHRSLIVHRDLKPSNILVTAEGEPKLLDFGIAKLLDPRLLDPKLFDPASSGDSPVETRHGQAPLTPRYASPEQVRGEPVTVATDVYSLGVVLYELLTGSSPYGDEDLNPATLARVICEREPPPASAAAEVADSSRVRFRARRLAGDVDAIVGKALRKEPGARYGSVAELAEDLARYLDSRPVLARRGARLYRAAKFARRHRWPLAAAGLFAALVAGFAVDRQLQLGRVAAERDKAREVTAFLVDLFRAADPGAARGETITVREVLDRGAERIDRELAGQPETRATMLETVGGVYHRLGLVGPARPLLDRAVDLRRELADGRALASALLLRGENAQVGGDAGRAAEDFTEGEALLRAAGAPGSEVAGALLLAGRLAQERADFAGSAERLERAIELLRDERPASAGEGRIELDGALAEALVTLALTRQLAGAGAGAEAPLAEAEELARTAVDADPIRAGLLLNDVAMAHHIAGRSPRALELLVEARTVLDGALDSDHAERANVANSLGVVQVALGRYPEAESTFRAALGMWTRLVGREHPRTALAEGNLGSVLLRRGAFADAEPRLRETLRLDRALLPVGHPDLAVDQRNLADALRELGRLDEAEALYLGSAELLRRGVGEESEPFATGELQLARLRLRQGRHADAELLCRSGLARMTRLWPEGHPRLAAARTLLGRILVESGRAGEAETELGAALAYQGSALPGRSADLAETRALLGAALLGRGDVAGARAALEPALAVQEEILVAGHPTLIETRWRLAAAARALGDPDAARAQLTRALTDLGSAQGRGHPLLPRLERDLAALGRAPVRAGPAGPGGTS